MMPRVLLFMAAVAAAACARSGEPTPASAPQASTQAASAHVEGRTTTGALVVLEPSGGAPLPDGNAVLDQFSKAFVPETLFVRVGQRVIFKNSEDQLHNVTVVRSRTGAAVFNISQNQGDTYTHTFEQAGEYDVTCDVHPGMRGVIVATSSPYAAFADARGTFAFSNVPPGAYTLRVSAAGRQFERAVQVSGAHVDVGDVR
jgi:plastocyanin